jgi:manganese/zinc/iron transport system substrate-binding protein
MPPKSPAKTKSATSVKRNEMNSKSLSVLFVVILTLPFVGCESNSKKDLSDGDFAKGDKRALSVVATTGQINAALQKITKGTGVNIKLFCGPGVDPHSFSASTSDVQAMLDADLIVYNGFHLEAKLSEHLHDAFKDKAWSMASAFSESARLDWVEDGEVDPDAPFDPHIWNHLPAWSKCVTALAARLGETDEVNADKYKTNAEQYVKEILDAHEWAKEKLAKVPEANRTIVSAHDAFNYFANLYGMETLAVLGIGNDPEADIKTMKSVAETICDRKIPAIFMESITNPKVTQALQEACAARDWNVTLVDQPLYSDDIGEKAPQNTFLGAFKSNVEVISASLSK